MIESFKNFIEKEELFHSHENVLLGVSGGIDSVVMADLFHHTGYSFGIAHCNFALRGKESDQDEAFVRKLSEKYHSRFHTTKFNTKEYASENKISTQMAARDLRYEWFDQIRETEGYKYIAVAHHLDDEIETFFINIVRGTGISGLHGIYPKRGYLIRPLLFAERRQIEEYASDELLEHREDSSNQEVLYMRNKLRHEVIPVLKKLNPSLNKTIHEEILRIREVEDVYRSSIKSIEDQLITKEHDNFLIPLNKLTNIQAKNTILFELLRKFGFNRKVTDTIIGGLDNQSGKVYYSDKYKVIKDREQLIITLIDKNTRDVFIIPESLRKIDKPLKIHIDKIELHENFTIPFSNEVSCLDYNKLKFPLTLRRWRDGDYFYPLGLGHRKKVSDFFIDQKLALTEKERTWLLTTADDEIAWIVGKRIDDRFKVSDNTEIIYKLVIED